VSSLVSSLFREFKIGIQGHGLAAAGGAGDQQQPLRGLDAVLQGIEGGLFKTQLGQIDVQRSLVENTEHHRLAEQGGQGGDPEIHDLVLADPHLDAAVLRHPPFGDVEIRQDLEPRVQGVLDIHRQVHGLVQVAVQPVAHLQVFLKWFDMDIADAVGDRLHQNAVHQLDDRGIGGGILVETDLVTAEALVLIALGGLGGQCPEVVDLGDRLLFLVVRLFPAAQQQVIFFVADLVVLAIGLDKVLFRGNRHHEAQFQLGLQLFHGMGVRGFSHGDIQGLFLKAQGKGPIFSGQLVRQDLDGLRGRGLPGNQSRGVVVNSTQDIEDGILLDVTEADEDTAEPGGALLLNRQGFLQLAGVDVALFTQQIADLLLAGPGLILDGGPEAALLHAGLL